LRFIINKSATLDTCTV